MSIDEGANLFGCIFTIICIVVYVIAGGFFTEYSIEYGVSFIKEAPVNVPFYVATIIGVVAFPVTVITSPLLWGSSFIWDNPYYYKVKK